MHVTARIIEVPGSGYITDFECQLNDPKAPAGFGVVALDFVTMEMKIKCLVKSFGGGEYPENLDYVI